MNDLDTPPLALYLTYCVDLTSKCKLIYHCTSRADFAHGIDIEG